MGIGKFSIVFGSFFTEDGVATPTLTADSPNAIDGSDVLLTCATTTDGVETYEFFKDGVSLGAASASDTYNIRSGSGLK